MMPYRATIQIPRGGNCRLRCVETLQLTRTMATGLEAAQRQPFPRRHDLVRSNYASNDK
jgi:hypothetical protein